MVTFVNRAKMSVSSTGTGTLTLNAAIEGYQTFADAGVADSDVVRYVIEDGNNWEIGSGIYTSSGTTLSRTVSESSNAGAEISVTLNAFVYVAAAAEDILQPAGGTMTGALILNADPTVALQAATKGYVDTIAAAGLHYHLPVRVESPAPSLSVTYNNGTAGVGATLTNAGTQAALVLDGITLDVDDRVLIYEQTDATQNGVYVVTDIGSGSTNWVLTRAADADSYAPSSPDSLGQGDAFFVLEGNTAAGELYVCNTEGTITFGTTNITFVQVAATAVYSAGTGLDLTGTVFSIDNTVVTADGTQTLTNKTLSNSSVSGDLLFPDNSKAIFGAGNDLIVYHDGTDSFVQDQGTGDLRLQTNGAKVNIYNSANSQVMAHFNTAGSVDLYYNGSQKLATTNTGIDVTGNLSAGVLISTGAAILNGSLSINAATTENRSIEVGFGRTGDGNSFVDLIGDATYTDFGARFLRGSGANGVTQVVHRGTGGFSLITDEAAPITLVTDSAERMRITNVGNVGIGTASPASKLDVAGTVTGTALYSTSGFIENSQTVSADYTLVATRNAMSAGPIEVASGVTVTIETGARWVVI